MGSVRVIIGSYRPLKPPRKGLVGFYRGILVPEGSCHLAPRHLKLSYNVRQSPVLQMANVCRSGISTRWDFPKTRVPYYFGVLIINKDPTI